MWKSVLEIMAVYRGLEIDHLWRRKVWTSTVKKQAVNLISSSSPCRAASTDIHDPLPSLLSIVHRLWQVFRVTSRILTLLLNVCSSWSSCFCPAIRGCPLEYIIYELVPTSLSVSCMSSSSNLDSFRDRRQVAV